VLFEPQRGEANRTATCSTSAQCIGPACWRISGGRCRLGSWTTQPATTPWSGGGRSPSTSGAARKLGGTRLPTSPPGGD